MKKLHLFIAIISVLTIYSCYKPSVPLECTWTNTTVGGKTYKITKITVLGIDSTSRWQTLYPCLKNTYTANIDGTYKMLIAAGCTDPDSVGIWKTYTASGTNYLISGNDTNKVVSFNCSSFTTEVKIDTFKASITYTKQ